MLTPQQEQMLALQAMLEEQKQTSPETAAALLGASGAGLGTLLGRGANRAINVGNRLRGKPQLSTLRSLKRPAGLALALAGIGGGLGYGIQSQINQTVPSADAIAKAALGQELNMRDRQLLTNAIAQAYSNQNEMINMGLV